MKLIINAKNAAFKTASLYDSAYEFQAKYRVGTWNCVVKIDFYKILKKLGGIPKGRSHYENLEKIGCTDSQHRSMRDIVCKLRRGK